ncbi:MAG: choline dehydrogenase-like flavoprotein [Saprospiraceae bacterium]|jgi:choline dehydrogenase-like flavoprotein
MSNINGKSKAERTYDAIVVGSGISGGWAAKELCEKGLKTIVLDRGRDVKHIEDYPTANKDPWEFKFGGKISQKEIDEHYPKQNRTGYTVRAQHKHFFVKDSEHPYNEINGKRFDWIRGYQVGGRSLVWGRQCYRWSDYDFEANMKDGHGVDWPIRYKDIASWYSYVEKFAGISGQSEGLPQLPDSEFLPPMDYNCIEKHVRSRVKEQFNDRIVTIGRTAHLTVPHNGRGQCQSRNRCMRGCPYGAYFSSQSSTLPAAEKTGNLTIRPFSIATEVMYDKETGKATGVRIIDKETKEIIEYYAKVVFLCASAVASTSILMQSKPEGHENGLGNESGALGKYLMDHHFKAGARAEFDGFEDQYFVGRRPNGTYVPRFRNLGGDTDRDYVRGFGYQGGGSRGGWHQVAEEKGFGADLKKAVQMPGGWTMNFHGFGETLPYEDNFMQLNYDKLDSWGLPTVDFNTEIKENEMKMREDMKASAKEMLEAAGGKNVQTYDDKYGVGLGIHEMGTARMGRDRKTSVLNGHNQVWGAENVFVTDGACMTSASCVNPSLTYMALTARAADFAAKALKSGKL